MMKVYQNVQFRTLDGIYLRGRLYAAAQRGPAVILCPGYNSVVDSFPAAVPEEFQKAGITALLYDPRNTGKSGGFPRNDIDPFKQVEDYSDAFCYLTTLPIVDAKAIVFWGISLSAGIALSAASLDKRIAAVIAIAPVFKFLPVTEKDARRLKTKMIKDRESQLLRGNPPYVLPIAESLAEIPFNSHVNANRGDDEEQRKRAEEEQMRQQQERWKEEAVEAGQEYDERLIHNPYGTTIQSYHRMFLFESIPLSMVKEVWPTPVMFLTPEKDQISPPQHQIEVFESLRGPKRQVFAPGKEHVYVMEGPGVNYLMKLQIDFLWQAVRGLLKAST